MISIIALKLSFTSFVVFFACWLSGKALFSDSSAPCPIVVSAGISYASTLVCGSIGAILYVWGF